MADNRFEEALETLSEMQKILPDAFEAYDLQAQIYIGQGKYEEALWICNKGCDRFPDDAVLALTKLKVLVTANKDSEAMALIQSMKKMPQYNAVMKESVMQEAILHLRKEDVDAALQILNQANDALNDDADLLYVLLDLYAKMDVHDKTNKIAKKLIECKPNAYYLYTAKFFLAHSAQQQGNVDFAKAEYKKLSSELRKYTIKNPGFYEGYIFRLLCHARIGEFKKALDLTDYIENVHPERIDAYSFRHYIYNLMGETEKAEAEKKKALSIDPNARL